MWILAFATLILSACSSYDFYSVNSSKADISKYRSYAWIRGNESKLEDYYDSDIAEDKIIESANAALESKGLKLDNRRPELLIRYTAVVDSRSKTISDPVYYQGPSMYVPVRAYYRGRQVYYYRYYRPFPVYVGSEQRKVEFDEGNIIIDLIDKKSSRVVWRGVARGQVDNPEKAVSDLPKVIGKIFKKLPS